jgi:hypothetical protein
LFDYRPTKKEVRTMEVKLENNQCIVTRGTTRRVYSDSLLWHWIKLELKYQKHDVIKKRMQKDGHLMGDETTQYVRTRDQKHGFMVYDGSWAIRPMYEDFNKFDNGQVILQVERY